MAILITGASAGFGEVMAKTFIQAGYSVIGSARRMDKLTALQKQLGEHFYPLMMDMNDENSIKSALSQITQPIDCLINNAGLALGLNPAQSASWDDWATMMQTNMVGLTFLTHQVLPQMVARKSGYIINMGSIAGNYPYPGGNVYGATKAYVRQFSLNLRADLHGTGVRVTNIEPGLVGGSEFSNVRFKGDDTRAAQLYENANALTPQDIADTALWLYQRPAHMNVNTLELMPVTQSFAALSVHKTPPPTTPNITPQISEHEEKTHGLLDKITSLFK